MDTQSSQKKSRHSSAKSERNRAGMGQSEQPHRPVLNEDDEEYMDHSIDHVARVRAAKEAAQRELESFGDVAEYEVTTIQGLLKETPAAGSQGSLDFPGDGLREQQEAR